jgi:diaminopimelate epimerase
VNSERLRFWKMSGSGNDFVVVDARAGVPEDLTAPGTVKRLCARGTGVGADGLVLLEEDRSADFRMVYYNSDGSRAEMCGNAALCITRLAADLGAGNATGMRFGSDAGTISARIGVDARPEVDLAPVTDIRPDAGLLTETGELRIGFADAGVPHLVVLCKDVEKVDVVSRGGPLRRHASLPRGANVNFVSRVGEGWAMRTFERGVEGETLACGTGAAAVAVLLNAWGESGERTALTTRSGERLAVRLTAVAGSGGWVPSLSGQGRIVFQGELVEL